MSLRGRAKEFWLSLLYSEGVGQKNRASENPPDPLNGLSVARKDTITCLTMYIFIDESGVHKQEGRSSIALVYLSTEHVDVLQRHVIETEKKLKIEYFHWSHSTWPVREKFVEAICKQDFSIKVALIRNPFYTNKAYEYALQHLVIEKNISNIIIDGKKSRVYERKIKKVLRDKGISVKKLKTANDEGYPALRVADAVAGLVRYRVDNPQEKRAEELYQMIAKKVLITLEE